MNQEGKKKPDAANPQQQMHANLNKQKQRCKEDWANIVLGKTKCPAEINHFKLLKVVRWTIEPWDASCLLSALTWIFILIV